MSLTQEIDAYISDQNPLKILTKDELTHLKKIITYLNENYRTPELLYSIGRKEDPWVASIMAASDNDNIRKTLIRAIYLSDPSHESDIISYFWDNYPFDQQNWKTSHVVEAYPFMETYKIKDMNINDACELISSAIIKYINPLMDNGGFLIDSMNDILNEVFNQIGLIDKENLLGFMCLYHIIERGREYDADRADTLKSNLDMLSGWIFDQEQRNKIDSILLLDIANTPSVWTDLLHNNIKSESLILPDFT